MKSLSGIVEVTVDAGDITIVIVVEERRGDRPIPAGGDKRTEFRLLPNGLNCEALASLRPLAALRQQ